MAAQPACCRPRDGRKGARPIFGKLPAPARQFVRVVHQADVAAETASFVARLAEIVNGAGNQSLRFDVRVEPPSSDFVPLVGLADGLRALFEGYRLADARAAESLKPIEDHHRRLSERLGVALEPPELTLTFAADALIERGRTDAALEVLQFQARVHEGSLNALWRLGEINRKLGKLEAARDYYQRFLAIQPNDASLIRKRLAEVEQAIAKK